ncbi:unnamed protein product [Staurois parvus]|uniref:Uncharacterized protein n=1 Tax=Staurois parvus TaxID=386267 RepID=A0ABN9B8R6_9NEOB|nr:unnamed protein product [Staurois parvus]
MCPRYRLTIHKEHRFLRMHTWHPAVKPSAHTTEAGKTARLDRGTGKMTADLWGGGAGYLNLTGTRSYFRRVFV